MFVFLIFNENKMPMCICMKKGTGPSPPKAQEEDSCGRDSIDVAEEDDGPRGVGGAVGSQGVSRFLSRRCSRCEALFCVLCALCVFSVLVVGHC